MKLFVNESVETSKWFCEDQTIFHMRPKTSPGTQNTPFIKIYSQKNYSAFIGN